MHVKLLMAKSLFDFYNQKEKGEEEAQEVDRVRLHVLLCVTCKIKSNR